MSSFGTQSSHEVSSLKLKGLLIAQRDHPDVASQLQRFAATPIVMANYTISKGWFTSAVSISQRLPDLVSCSGFENLAMHLCIPVDAASDEDTLAVTADRARDIRSTLAARAL